MVERDAIHGHAPGALRRAAPFRTSPSQMLELGLVTRFDVIPKRTIIPSWQQELSCKTGSCWAEVESGASGSVWVRTLDGYDGHVLAVNDQGETVAHYKTEIGGTLLGARDGDAMLAQWNEGNELRISSFDTEGTKARHALTLPEAPTEIRFLTVAPSDDGIRVAVFNLRPMSQPAQPRRLHGGDDPAH